MATEVPSPIGLTFETWAAFTADLSSATGELPTPATEADWQRWGAALLLAPQFQIYGLPQPQGFGDWREWALAVSRAFTGTQ